MAARIRARFENGVFMPLEDLDLPEGQEVSMTITAADDSTDDEIEIRLYETTRELLQMHHRNRRLTAALQQAKMELQAQTS